MVWYTLNPFSATLYEGLTLYPVPISFPTFIANLGVGMAVLQATAARRAYNMSLWEMCPSPCVYHLSSQCLCAVCLCACVLV